MIFPQEQTHHFHINSTSIIRPVKQNQKSFSSILLQLTPAASATDAAIQRKNFGSCMTTLIILNEEMDELNLLKNLIY